jgi:hypothetical protein
MKHLTRFLLCAALLATAMAARAERVFNQAELDALLAPVALYPDPVLNDILVATSYPYEVRDAAAWSRANPQLSGSDALNAAQPYPWQPSVKALVAFPELLARMDESPQWLADLGEAYRVHGHYVMDTVQGLRLRAQANGYPPEPVAPAQPQVVVVRYYDPYVVYGPWFWPAFRPIIWRPWVHHVVVHGPVYVYRPHVVVHRPVHVHRPVVVHTAPVHVHRPAVVHVHRPAVVKHTPAKFAPQRVPESQRQPIVQQLRPSVQQHRPQAQGNGVFRAAESRGHGNGRSSSHGHGNDRRR